MSVCRSCGAPIRWAITLNGKAIPLNTGSAADGNFRAVVLAGGDLDRARENGVRLYYPHHGSCPDRKQWKR